MNAAWSYNADGSLHDLAHFGVTGQAYTQFDVVYGANGKPTNATYSNGMSKTWTYNADGSLHDVSFTGVTGQPYTSYDVHYGPVWRHASRFTFHATVSTWLLAIARRKAMSELRRRKYLELDADIADNLSDQSEDPEAAVQRKVSAQVLQRASADLSPAHSEVLELVYYHGKSVKDVAVITGVPEATVKTRMFYARKRLMDVARAIAA
jgi:RNA polymerase sigma-70 factor (ECF subfamily)